MARQKALQCFRPTPFANVQVLSQAVFCELSRSAVAPKCSRRTEAALSQVLANFVNVNAAAELAVHLQLA